MTTAPSRSSYHHGDLRRALVDVAVAVARAGGPDAVVLRDVARQVGVSHNAGYRHFASRDDLLQVIAERGLAELGGAMREALAAVPAGLDPQEAAIQRVRATGRGYVRYALAEPGMFRTIWTCLPAPGAEGDVERDPELDPYAILGRALDELVVVGLLEADRRPHTEVVAWSAVHGLSTLLMDGPLRGMPPEEAEASLERLFDVVENGVARNL